MKSSQGIIAVLLFVVMVFGLTFAMNYLGGFNEVKNPVAVRYAWSNNPEDANLYNGSDLPASSFRTDNWKGITQ